MSNIEWTDRTWNPTRGCTRVSEGCRNCYAERQAIRQSGPRGGYEGLVASHDGGPRWTGKVRFVSGKLDEPLTWKKPARVFVDSMSDLFHEGVTSSQRGDIFGVMAAAERHTFQVLTKRAAAMKQWVTMSKDIGPADGPPIFTPFPLPNVWLGVSVENQAAADERIPLLLETPAAVRFLSVEPLLGPVDLRDALGFWATNAPRVDWVIVGGESGPRARPCGVGWIRSIVDQCRSAGVACFVKQLGARPRWVGGDDLPDDVVTALDANGYSVHDIHRAATEGLVHVGGRKGGDMAEWPADLRVRQFPKGGAR